MAGLTPGSVIRGLGPWGPNLIDKYVNGRFSVHGKHAAWDVLVCHVASRRALALLRPFGAVCQRRYGAVEEVLPSPHIVPASGVACQGVAAVFLLKDPKAAELVVE
jgi:hypothetical protein